MTKKKVLCVDMGGGKSSSVIMEDLAPTLACTHYGEPVVFYEEDICREEIFQMARGRGKRIAP